MYLQVATHKPASVVTLQVLDDASATHPEPREGETERCK